MRGWVVAATLVAASALGVGLVAAAAGRTPPASLSFVQDVPADVRHLTEVTWRSFGERFDARASCWDDVSVELVRKIDGGDARYVVADARIEIQIPTTPDRYRESLVHELAHHVEHTCPDVEPLRAALAPALGATVGSWYSGPSWEATPSERFAEAVVEYVLGERVRHHDEVAVDDDVLALIRQWAIGEELAHASVRSG